jgi:hypothetical protein
MATKTVTQLHRVSFSRWDGSKWNVVNFEPDDLGQDTQATINIAPRKSSRASSVGTTTKPIAGTLNEFSASVTILFGYYKALGQALGVWNDATYTGHDANAGNIVGGSGDLCDDGVPVRVVVQGICDDGSTADVELTRCYPSLDDDLEIGASDTSEVTIALNPQIYNSTTMSGDGYPAYSYKLGDNSTTANKRYNATSGEYADASES